MPDFNGKTWFRENLAPYLSIIKSQMSGYAPIITSTNLTEIQTNVVETIVVTGDFFTPDLVVASNTLTISNFVFVSQTEIQFDVTTTTAEANTVSLTTPFGAVTLNILSVSAPPWIDLRSGSGSVFTEQHRAGTNFVRDADGAGTTGAIFSSWLRFNSHQWDRNTPKRLSIIGKANDTHMIGIMSTQNQNETASGQYFEAEIYAYVASTYVYGFYGTNISGGGVSQYLAGGSFGGKPYYKLQFNDNGEAGSTFRIFGLADLSNFDDESNLVATWTVPASFTANDTPIMPCITGGATSRIVAYLVEDM